MREPQLLALPVVQVADGIEASLGFTFRDVSTIPDCEPCGPTITLLPNIGSPASRWVGLRELTPVCPTSHQCTSCRDSMSLNRTKPDETGH
jgi:hypothetical protein